MKCICTGYKSARSHSATIHTSHVNMINLKNKRNWQKKKKNKRKATEGNKYCIISYISTKLYNKFNTHVTVLHKLILYNTILFCVFFFFLFGSKLFLTSPGIRSNKKTASTSAFFLVSVKMKKLAEGEEAGMVLTRGYIVAYT